MSTSREPFAGARLTIDLEALAMNYQAVVDRVAPAQVAAVVKANAYGLGDEVVARTLIAAGCTIFFVAHLSEAQRVRRLSGDVEIYILNGLVAGAEQACADARCTPVINALEQLEPWKALGVTLGRPLPAAIQIDTGMSRLGLSEAEVQRLVDDPGRLNGIDLRLVMSHLACADSPGAAATEAQRLSFEVLAARLQAAPRSLSNSGGAFGPSGLHHDLVRAGIVLYGGAPLFGAPNPMRPVVGLEASIIQVRTVPDGAGVGYGLSHVVRGERRLATLSIGYADGWPRRLGNRGSAFIEGVRVPIVGRVSMDSMVIDVTEIGAGRARAGAWVELIGPHQSIDQVAEDADTIAYEILTGLGARFERIYRAAPGAAARPGALT